MLPHLSKDSLAIVKQLPRVGVAVSGGGDSVALLRALHQAFEHVGPQVFAASVNHGLRPEAATECAFVHDLCQSLKVPHTTLAWDGTTAQGNLQAAAREARYRLLATWAQKNGITHVFLGHTADDQAETVMMALGRGAGPDGLSGMRPEMTRNGINYLRPYLHVTRAALRRSLRDIGQSWMDDPSNEDMAYQRVRLRQLLPVLSDAGVPLEAFGQVAENMAAVSDMLQSKTQALLDAHVIADRGDYLIRQDVWMRCGPEECRRLVTRIIKDIAGPNAAPRRAEQAEVLKRLRRAEPATLAGCRLTLGWGMVRFAREYRTVQDTTSSTDQIWDGRWRLDGPHAPDLRIAALGEGLSACPEWRQTGVPAASLRATPAVWRGDILIAAPIAGHAAGWTAQIVADSASSTASH